MSMEFRIKFGLLLEDVLHMRNFTEEVLSERPGVLIQLLHFQ